jgi:hypothetical protein
MATIVTTLVRAESTPISSVASSERRGRMLAAPAGEASARSVAAAPDKRRAKVRGRTRITGIGDALRLRRRT